MSETADTTAASAARRGLPGADPVEDGGVGSSDVVLDASAEGSRRRPDGGGLRAGLTGVATVRAPRLVSVLVSTLTVFAVLVALGWGVVVLDGVLAGVLTGSPLPGSRVFATLSLVSLSVAAVQSFRLPLTPSGDPVPYLRRERRRFLVVVVALAAALVFGVCWAAGRI